MTASELFELVRDELHSKADPAWGEGARIFFKGTADPIGVGSADMKPIEQRTARELKKMEPKERWEFCSRAWESGIFEAGVVVLHTMRPIAKKFGREEFNILDGWIDSYIHNWAHCDGLSTWLLAPCIANDPSLTSRLYLWCKSKNRWRRRAAAVSLLIEGKKGRHTDEIVRMAVRLGHDEDDMVQKGVGWMLKEAYGKQPEAVLGYLLEHRPPRRVVRYAAEKMTAEDKTKLGLGLKKVAQP